MQKLIFMASLCGAFLPLLSPAATVKNVAALDALRAQAAQSKKLVVVFVSSSDPGCRDCALMRKDYFKDREFMDWVNRYSMYGEIDVNRQGRSANEIEAAAAAASATQAPTMPAMVLLHPNGRMLEYRPSMSDVPSQVATLFHKIYLEEVSGVFQPGSAMVSVGVPPGQSGTRSATAPAPAWAPPNAVPVRYDGLKLRSITGTGSRQFVLINDQTLAAGESSRITMGGKKVSVRCVEIREGQVVVQMEGEPKPRLLILQSTRKQATASR